MSRKTVLAVLLVLLSSSVYAQGNKVKISFLWWSDPGGGFERVVKDFERENPRRVALSRAITKRPRVFLLDEPLSNLDAVLRERMRLELKTLFRRLKATVIYVTHEQVEAMSLSDKIAVIDKGESDSLALQRNSMKDLLTFL